MTLQEILKAQGLSDEQIQAIAGEMTKNKVFIASEENLDIRYKDLQNKFDGKDKECKEAVALITQLKKDNAGNEGLQGKIGAYEGTIQTLQSELEQAKLDSALKIALLEAKAVDIDYLTYKIKSGEKELALDENGRIKGFDDTIESVKKQHPTQFETNASKKVDENKLPDNDDHSGFTKEGLLKKTYAERLKIYEENPEAFNEVMNEK